MIDSKVVVEGYRLLLGRDPESEEVVLEKLALHNTKEALFFEIATSEEFKALRLCSHVDRESVVEAYRLLLARHPESEEVIQKHCTTQANLAGVYTSLVQSEEFQERQRVGNLAAVAHRHLAAPVAVVEVNVDQDVLIQLQQRVQKQWVELGNTDPYWSVLTEDRYRNSRITEEAKREFYSSGSFPSGLVSRFEQSTGAKVPRNTCFELGCGVGRITYWLARQFERVVAADISPGNLSICKRNLASMGVDNVEFIHLTNINQLDSLPTYDCLVSFIVLQHNPPQSNLQF